MILGWHGVGWQGFWGLGGKAVCRVGKGGWRCLCMCMSVARVGLVLASGWGNLDLSLFLLYRSE